VYRVFFSVGKKLRVKELNRKVGRTESNAMNKDQYEYLGNQIFLAALEVHKHLGPGLLESVYEYAMRKELELRRIDALFQYCVPLYYKTFDTQKDFYIDILVENEIVIELKAVDVLHPVHEAQLISYLKLANKRLGFLIFNVPLIKDGFKRKVNDY
jgi:GxxExxY protein